MLRIARVIRLRFISTIKMTKTLFIKHISLVGRIKAEVNTPVEWPYTEGHPTRQQLSPWSAPSSGRSTRGHLHEGHTISRCRSETKSAEVCSCDIVWLLAVMSWLSQCPTVQCLGARLWGERATREEHVTC